MIDTGTHQKFTKKSEPQPSRDATIVTSLPLVRGALDTVEIAKDRLWVGTAKTGPRKLSLK